MSSNDEQQMTEFANELTRFLLPHFKENKNPLMLAGVLMSCAMELYTTSIKDNQDIYHLLEVVAASVEDIREKNNKTLH